MQCLDSLLSVLVKEMGPERKNMEAVQVAERFVRSVVRVFTVCHTESVCVPSGSLVTSTSASARRKRSVQVRSHHFSDYEKIGLVLWSFHKFLALIARYGKVRKEPKDKTLVVTMWLIPSEKTNFLSVFFFLIQCLLQPADRAC